MILLFFVLGLVLLVAGGELLVRGASRLALSLGVSPLVVGLTIVAFGTSTPELAVSVQAAFKSVADIAVGNVVGSNIFNLLFILGVSAVIVPLRVDRQLQVRDVPVMTGATLLVWWFARDGGLQRGEGVVLFSLVVAYTSYLVLSSRTSPVALEAEYAEEFGEEVTTGPKEVVMDLGFIIAGLVCLGFGMDWMVDSAVKIARQLGVSELIIGLTIISIGTSLPEVVTSLMAAWRGERDIAVGNVVGSNIFNLLCVLGASASISPKPIAIASNVLAFDYPVLIAITLLCIPMFLTGQIVDRWEGGLFVAFYCTYTGYLMMTAQGSDGSLIRSVALWVLIPATVLVLGKTVWEHTRARKVA